METKNIKTKINYGFIPPVVESSDFFLGSKKLNTEIINPSRNWKIDLPRFEAQNKGQETSACVTFTILSNIETLEKFLYGGEPNYSDRWIAKMSETDPAGGNNPKKVCETIKKYGLVNEEDYPFVDDVNEFYKDIPLGLYQVLIEKGKKWLEKYDFGYEWVDVNLIDVARERSPISVAVYAWSKNSKKEFIRLGASNHYTLNFVKDTLDRLEVFDSYENPIIKTLAKEHNVEYAQIYKLSKKQIEVKKNFLKVIHNFFLSLFSKFCNI